MRMPTLRPCPFCGGEARMEFTSDFAGSGGLRALVIFVRHDENCILRYKDTFNYGFMDFDLDAYPSTAEHFTLDFALEWNRRDG